MTRSGAGVLVVMGSGETSPTMVTLHERLLARHGREPAAFVLDTPAGFQENVDDLTAKAVRYFADSVGAQVEPLIECPRGRVGDKTNCRDHPGQRQNIQECWIASRLHRRVLGDRPLEGRAFSRPVRQGQVNQRPPCPGLVNLRPRRHI